MVVAVGRKLDVSGSAVTARVAFAYPGGFRLDVTIEAELPGLDAEAAAELVEAADQVCPCRLPPGATSTWR